MKATNTRILVAPILAIIFALFLAGAITSLPFIPQNAASPSPMPTAGSTQQPQQMSVSIAPWWIIYIAGAVMVIIIAAFLFFSEKSLAKELQE